ncbi:hypothetical protein [Sulfitobacter guttiformis]|uniref:Sulfotransferase family protein n=1 Tax=Sulfitobacter guttiformis TaxID=74349 RepID=A0A420DIJ0_9RHOB|nr:hypothetical protein [Sulfitobacter guttiformis]KIN72202.1 hypothetical protein Z949_1374 [Sulfitobacter guttiformis KCTC 32187]RKE94027.1 hypothetical protein C8N30_3132 [Sulfitobacter guttiformis]
MTMAHAPDAPDFEAVAAQIAPDMARTGWHMHHATSAQVDRFQVLGERGCGTNVIRKVVHESLRIRKTEALGWKHGFPQMIALPPTFLTIIAVRNPRSWAHSLYKRPWHAVDSVQALGFSDFLRSPWHAYVDKLGHFDNIAPRLAPHNQPLQWDRHPITGAAFPNIFAMRNLKHRALMGMPTRGASCVFVSLDAFNAAPQAFLADLAKTFALAPTERGYAPVARRMGNRFTPVVSDRAPAPETWMEADLEWMKSQLDPATETALGFAV